MADWETLLDGIEDSGVHQCGPNPGELIEAATSLGYKAWRVDLARAKTKADFLSAMATALSFPAGFGGNWDAFVDCMRDLSWIGEPPGYLIVLENCDAFHKRQREDFGIAADCLAEAVAFWKDQGRSCWVLLCGPVNWDSGFPALRANS